MNYQDFKTLMLKKEAVNLLQYEDQGEQYSLWYNENLDRYSCYIEKTEPVNEDQEDFELNYKTNANKSLLIRAEDNTPFTRIIEHNQGKLMQLRGFEIACPAEETTELYLQWENDVEFIGGRAQVFNSVTGIPEGSFGSTASMQVVDKDNVFGYGAGFVLAEFAKDVPLKLLQTGCVIESTTSFILIKELYIKVIIVNNGEEVLKLCLGMRFFQ